MQKFASWMKRNGWFVGLMVVALAGAWVLGWRGLRQTASQPSQRLVTQGGDPELQTASDYFEAGNAQFDAKHYENAIAYYGQALVLQPDYAEAYNNRAYAYMTLEKYDLALIDLNKAIELRPNYVNALMNRGDIYNYYYNVDTAKALTDYDKVLALDPTMAGLCGHRLLAEHNGWNLGTLGELISRREKSGC